jgi:hypothetical protein
VAGWPIQQVPRHEEQPTRTLPFERPQPAAPLTESPVAAGGGASTGRPPLPRRVRQANLDARLSEPTPPLGMELPGERSPEELRTMMSAFQKGTLRGRSEAAETDKES